MPVLQRRMPGQQVFLRVIFHVIKQRDNTKITTPNPRGGLVEAAKKWAETMCSTAFKPVGCYHGHAKFGQAKAPRNQRNANTVPQVYTRQSENISVAKFRF